MLTPYLTAVMLTSDYGEMNLVYAIIPFLNVVFLYGLDTAYFRFSQKDEHKEGIYGTSSLSIITTTLLFTGLMVLFREPNRRPDTFKES